MDFSKISKTNEELQSKKDAFDIGIMQIVDGLVAVISFGNCNSGYSAKIISKTMLKNIKIRKDKRELELKNV